MLFARIAVVSLCLVACGSPEASSYLSESSSEGFPQNPNVEVTPGSKCQNPDEYRYQEKIPYCNRDVDSTLKKEIIAEYDAKFGYKIQTMPRNHFKIDHYIPLCMGGSNEQNNLWPQHKSVYVFTDSIEQKLCQIMMNGDMKQVEAIEIIKNVKNHLDQAGTVETELNERLGKTLMSQWGVE